MKDKYILNDRECVVIKPPDKPNGRWIWRTEFLSEFDYADNELLKLGWHIAYCRVSDMYGCPEAIEAMKRFHDDVVERYNLNKKADIFGFSRGGLYAVNYARRYPYDVSTLYLDAPVLDIFSWPGGYGRGQYEEKLWKQCLACYGATLETSCDITENPIRHLKEIIQLKIPIIIVAGDDDKVVPYNENGQLLYNEGIRQNAVIKVILKSGGGHHPHSLTDPSPIVEFIKTFGYKRKTDDR